MGSEEKVKMQRTTKLEVVMMIFALLFGFFFFYSLFYAAPEVASNDMAMATISMPGGGSEIQMIEEQSMSAPGNTAINQPDSTNANNKPPTPKTATSNTKPGSGTTGAST
eukprot:TRINITY_DN13529_c0_g1::TRINITY_DN13529_c0_g1_i1::g.22166::m.22166 TRINITY_DN13529_c0_g1::TRINITY_DN13529_c0_g1_i1::g.22166  ORF type:complete len:119 (+),score=6.48,DUF1183/PF06682.7/0.011,Nramp/PF01566.13/0.02,DUF3595/PF12166.3/0.096 TRINITY_DN13529_c0_g1_i1:29-358(+)